jgi:transposase
VRIVPGRDHYVVEIVSQRTPEQHDLDKHLIAGIDLGTDNLITLTSNQPGFTPVVVNGRGLKSINQYYNKERAAGQAEVGTLVIGYNPRWKQRVRLGRVTRRDSSRSRMPCPSTC